MSDSGKPTAVTRIFVVDDHPLVRQGLVELIDDQADLEVCGEAADAAAALRLTRRLEPDLLLVDLSLREGSGIELIEQVVAERPSVKILVCSMHDELLFAERCFAAGAMGYVSKQEPSRVVLAAMRRVVDGRMYASEEVSERALRRYGGRAAATEVEQRSPMEALSNRELEVFGLLGDGLGTREIAENLKLSSKTIDTYRENLKTKLGLRNASELLRLALAWTLDPSAVEVSARQDGRSSRKTSPEPRD